MRLRGPVPRSRPAAEAPATVTFAFFALGMPMPLCRGILAVARLRYKQYWCEQAMARGICAILRRTRRHRGWHARAHGPVRSGHAACTGTRASWLSGRILSIQASPRVALETLKNGTFFSRPFHPLPPYKCSVLKMPTHVHKASASAYQQRAKIWFSTLAGKRKRRPAVLGRSACACERRVLATALTTQAPNPRLRPRPTPAARG